MTKPVRSILARADVTRQDLIASGLVLGIVATTLIDAMVVFFCLAARVVGLSVSGGAFVRFIGYIILIPSAPCFILTTMVAVLRPWDQEFLVWPLLSAVGVAVGFKMASLGTADPPKTMRKASGSSQAGPARSAFKAEQSTRPESSDKDQGTKTK